MGNSVCNSVLFNYAINSVISETIDYNYVEEMDNKRDIEDVLLKSIAPNGDIYFLYRSPENVKIYRVPNTWNPKEN